MSILSMLSVNIVTRPLKEVSLQNKIELNVC